MSIAISQLVTGVPNGTIEFPATDPLNTSSSVNGTTFKYILTDVLEFILRAEGFTTYASCVVATVSDLTATYANGTAGVGATLTNAGIQAALAIDGVTLASGNRVLIKDQVNLFENGIYVVTTVGNATTNWVLTRADDYNQASEISYLGVVAITRGTANAGLVFQESSSGPFVIGTSPITFTQLSLTYSLLPSATPANKLLRSDGTYWVQSTNAALNSTDALTGLSDLVVDNIQINGNSITSVDLGGNVIITPNSVGSIVLDGLNWPQVDGTNGQAITTNGAGQLGWSTIPSVTPAALTEINDTNVTMTLGGNPNIALLQAVSMTLGWTGILSIARGGTNNNVIGPNGTLAQSDGTKYSWTTATYPGVATSANRLLRADGTNWVASTNTELTATDELSGLTKLDVDNLELNGNTVSSTDVNGDLILTPNGTGDLVLDGLNWPQADGSAGQAVTTNGLGQLGWTSFGAPYTPAALTSTSDSNVTITLGGTPATALLQASSITIGWSGLLPISRGGTNTSTLGTAGQLAQSDGTKYAWTTATYPATATATGTILRADGTNWVATTATYPATTSINHILYSSATNVIGEIADAVGGVLVSDATGIPSMLANPADNYRVLMSKSADKPAWSTAAYPQNAGASGTLMQSDGTDWTNTQATYPGSTNKDHILYSSANNTVGEIGTQKNAVLVSDNQSTPQWSGSLSDGQIIIGKTNDLPAAANLTAGTGISITNGNNSITITNTAPSSGTVNSGTANQLAYYATTGTTVSGLTSANNGVLITSGAGAPSISSTLPTAVQGNITSVGTITSGTWHGGIIGSTYGGTGVNNGSSTITLGGSLTTSGAFASTFTMTNTTAVTFPTSGTLATTSQLPTPAALTSTSDTNVTITLGGTPATALLQAASITMGWSGQLGVSRGGTGASSVGANGTLAQSNGSIYTFTTATYPSTTTANQLLYSSATNTVSGLTSANSATLVTNASGVPAWTGSMTNGQILIGSTGNTPTPATLTAGPGISIANAAASITISGTGSGIGWTEVTGVSQAMSADNGYVASNAGLVTLTLPTTAAFGTVINVQGKGAGGWKIAQNAGQTIYFGSSATTTGATGYLASTNRYDSVQLLCITANTEWAMLGGPQGNITVA